MNQQELLQLINRAAAEEWAELELYDQELIKLPPKIGQLNSLTKLYLSDNQSFSPAAVSTLSSSTPARENKKAVCAIG